MSAFVDADARPPRRVEQADCELGGVEHAAGVLDPEAAAEERRRDLGLHRAGVGEDLDLVSEPLV